MLFGPQSCSRNCSKRETKWTSWCHGLVYMKIYHCTHLSYLIIFCYICFQFSLFIVSLQFSMPTFKDLVPYCSLIISMVIILYFYFYKICKMSVCTNLNNPCVQNGNSLSYCFCYCKPADVESLSGLQVWCLSCNLKHVRFESSWIQYFQDNGFSEIRWCHLISS